MSSLSLDKENVAPHLFGDDPISPRKSSRRGRSKSIGPGGLIDSLSNVAGGDIRDKQQDAKARRKSTYIPTTKSIISTDREKAERQAARRRTLANRRVSFAPEATLHTWDVIEFMRDPTTSTDSPGSTRRASQLHGLSSPRRGAHEESDLLSSTPESVTSVRPSPLSPSPARSRASSSRTNLDHPDDELSDGLSESGSDVDGEDDGSEEDADGSDEDTGTAMSLDVDNSTAQSIASNSASTDSSGRLDAALRQAAEAAGTRGIEYDEYGDDVSMEIAGDEVTNAFKPWIEQRGSDVITTAVAEDQENVNPFAPLRKAATVSGPVSGSPSGPELNGDDVSMDMTRAIGGIIKGKRPQEPSSPSDDGTMELTQAVGTIKQTQHAPSPRRRSSQKRRRSTADSGSPEAGTPAYAKRRRSSGARSSLGDESMDLTMAVGGIEVADSPIKPVSQPSTKRRRSASIDSDRDDATMDMTQALGSIKSRMNNSERLLPSVDENEELTMELTTSLGAVDAFKATAVDEQPITPVTSPVQKPSAAITTPKDQERFKTVSDEGPKKLLTPVFQKRILLSAERSLSGANSLKSPRAPTSTLSDTTTPLRSPSRSPRKLHKTTLEDEKLVQSATAINSPVRTPSTLTAPEELKAMETVDEFVEDDINTESPLVAHTPTTPRTKLRESSKPKATPESTSKEPSQRLAESIKLMSTPRKESLRDTPTRQQSASRLRTSPVALASPPKSTPLKGRQTSKENSNSTRSDATRPHEGILHVADSTEAVQTVKLQEFLDLTGIRFMELTTTKRRMTLATTPSKVHRDMVQSEDADVGLENAVVSRGRTLPELEMFEHACRELRRYISDGKRVVKELESRTAKTNPPLIRAYMSGGSEKQAALESLMREMKTNARLRSKEMWYGWRSQLLEDLMKALQGIGEGLIVDDGILQRAEGVLEEVLPPLVHQHRNLRLEQDALTEENVAANAQDSEELTDARESLQSLEQNMTQKRRVLEELSATKAQMDHQLEELNDQRSETSAAISEAERVRAMCRGISLAELTELNDSVVRLEQASGWKITSAASSDSSITMIYKSQVALSFQPAAFLVAGTVEGDSGSRPNAPIGLTYLMSEPPSTTLRFFLQLVRASLHALPQCHTRLAELLQLVSAGWNSALLLTDVARRLNIEAPTDPQIMSDETLRLASDILIPESRTKVRVTFDVTAGAATSQAREPMLAMSVDVGASVVYGTPYNPVTMVECLERRMQSDIRGCGIALRDLRQNLVAGSLVAKGAKGKKA